MKQVRHRGNTTAVPNCQLNPNVNGHGHHGQAGHSKWATNRGSRGRQTDSKFSTKLFRTHASAWCRQFRRNPRLLFAYAVGSFLAFIFVLMWCTLLFFYRLNSIDDQTNSQVLAPGRSLNGVEVSGGEGNSSPANMKFKLTNDLASKGKVSASGEENSPQNMKRVSDKLNLLWPSRILFPEAPVSDTSFHLPEEGWDTEHAIEFPDYGGLEISFFADDESKRNIYVNPDSGQTDFYQKRHNPLFSKDVDNDMDGYYAFDDDMIRSQYVAYDSHDAIDEAKTCRRNSEYRLNLQNCNNVHEQELLGSGIQYLGEGAYRQVFLIEYFHEGNREQVVIKDLHYESTVDYENFEYIRIDALVAERLTASPRTFNIYGFCGLSIVSQFFRHGDVERLVVKGSGYAKQLDDADEVKPQNRLTPIQKLVIALEMAKGLAPLHGYKNGMMIHDDVQNSQYLFSNDFSMIILNDFNRAEMPLWDEENQEYCRYKNGHGHGNWRSPEEYADEPLTEKIDIWSLGCNMYSILTGLNPLYTVHSYKKYAKEILSGNLPTVDPRYKTRSTEEGKLADVIEKCFGWDPADRPSIFEIVDYLQRAVDECLGPGEDTAMVLKSIDMDPYWSNA